MNIGKNTLVNLSSLVLTIQYYILKYQIKNAGAGNAINLVFLIDNQKFMKPITLATNEERDIILILSSILIENSNRKLEMCFKYQDVASIAMYEQKEFLNFYIDSTGELNISQLIEDSISRPTEIEK